MLLGAGIGLPLNILAGMGRIPETWPRTFATYGKGVGDIFLRLLSMIVAPLILTSLVSGVTSSGTVQGLGRLGGRTLAYYLVTSPTTYRAQPRLGRATTLPHLSEAGE